MIYAMFLQKGMHMKFLASLTIRKRLAIGFGFIILIMLTLTILGIKNVNYIDNILSEITDINSVKQRYAINFRGSVHDRAIAVRDVGFARNESEINSLVREIRQLESFYNESESNMSSMLNSGIYFSTEEREILSRIEKLKSVATPLIEEIVSDARNDIDVTDIILNEARPTFIEYLNVINEFIDYQEEQNQIATPNARRVAGGFQELMLGMSAVALAMSIIVAVLIEKSLRQSLGGEPFDAQRNIRAFSQGDLSVDENNQYKGSILHSLADMGKKLTEIARAIASASTQLSKEVKIVAEGSSRIRDTADMQSSLTQQTADSLEAMRGQIDEVSELAFKTRDNSAQTVEFANEGKSVADATVNEIDVIAQTVNKTVKQVKELEERTKQIGGIINVISGISDQTNLLALNAAIEAARAGESGRGFAVVADEVRQLAQSTRDATAQIEDVISQVQEETAASVAAMETTQPQVEKGKEQIEKSSQLLLDIASQATNSLELASQVADSTNSQVDAIGKISLKMNQVSEMSGEAMEIISNNEKASQYLENLSEELKDQVSFFKI